MLYEWKVTATPDRKAHNVPTATVNRRWRQRMAGYERDLDAATRAARSSLRVYAKSRPPGVTCYAQVFHGDTRVSLLEETTPVAPLTVNDPEYWDL